MGPQYSPDVKSHVISYHISSASLANTRQGRDESIRISRFGQKRTMQVCVLKQHVSPQNRSEGTSEAKFGLIHMHN